MAIVVALLVAAFVLAIREPVQAVVAIAFAVGLSAVALVGLIDDHRPLSPWTRLLVHILASAVLASAWIVGGGDWKTAVLAFIACVCLTNIWNFMDGIDGLAASQAAIAAFAITLATVDEQALVALALAASCIGFLPFNFPRSRIFLGDVGSGALGFSIAALWLLAGDGARVPSTLMPMAVSAFVIDAGLTLLRRVLRGERWWTPHLQHAYQGCARRWGHVRVTISYGVWTALSVLIAQEAGKAGTALPWAIMAAWYTSGVLLWLWLQHCQVRRSRMIDWKDRTKADRK
jgi:UDP-N-acetylmuramyl pentapeptide phosphotransferase/UDP-N-acetylglucosamine-1-phosphate transferase